MVSLQPPRNPERAFPRRHNGRSRLYSYLPIGYLAEKKKTTQKEFHDIFINPGECFVILQCPDSRRRKKQTHAMFDQEPTTSPASFLTRQDLPPEGRVRWPRSFSWPSGRRGEPPRTSATPSLCRGGPPAPASCPGP